MSKIGREQPLRVEIVDGVVVISIGAETLASAVVMGPHLDEEFVVTDVDAFAAAIADALGEEEEDGTTVVHLMLDRAAVNAVESGCEGIEERDQ